MGFGTRNTKLVQLTGCSSVLHSYVFVVKTWYDGSHGTGIKSSEALSYILKYEHVVIWTSYVFQIKS